MAGVVGRMRPAAALWRLGPVSLREVREPVPPGPDWVLLEPLHAGICGSDVTQATLQADWDNPLSGLVSFPHVMGHEVVARVVDPGATDLAKGHPAVLNPWLGCAPRGLPPCPACAEGMTPLCAHGGEPIPGVDGVGIHTGNIRGLPGGMGERMVAHRSQLRRLPERVEPRAAVLSDPLAVGFHAAQRAMRGLASPAWAETLVAAGAGSPAVVAAESTPPRQLVVVLGAGTIGLATAAALRHLGGAEVLVSTAWEYQRQLVRALGARPVTAAATEVVTEVADATGGRLSRPWRGLPWLVAGGADGVVDAVGSAATGELALAIVRPGGTVVRVGVGRTRRSQATLTYFKEVAVVGSNGYRQQDFDAALAMLARGEVPWDDWLTHRLTLGNWHEAFRIAAEPQRHRAVKVSLDVT
jgi:threonine dehydrogenase-like Zn-dependent dehydrogenase